MVSDLNMFHGKMSDPFSFTLFGFTLVIKLRNFEIEGHSNTLIFFDKKDVMSDLNMSHGKMSDFVSFQLFVLTLVKKLRNFSFESHWKILIFLIKKDTDGVKFEYATWKNVHLHCKNYIFFHLHCLGSF